MHCRIRTAAVGAVVLLAAGCGSAGGVRVGAPDPGGTNISADCGDVVLDLAAKDTPRKICLSVGSTLRLRSGAGAAGGSVSGNALTEVSPGVYRGASSGSAELSGTRRACPDEPGKMSCLIVVPWNITVDVR